MDIKRIRRERKTVETMIGMYCRKHHSVKQGICADCESLRSYAMARIDRCPLKDNKPTCANCTVHCYKSDMREKVRMVMRFAGPRMIYTHPILAVMHIIDGKIKRKKS